MGLDCTRDGCCDCYKPQILGTINLTRFVRCDMPYHKADAGIFVAYTGLCALICTKSIGAPIGTRLTNLYEYALIFSLFHALLCCCDILCGFTHFCGKSVYSKLSRVWMSKHRCKILSPVFVELLLGFPVS